MNVFDVLPDAPRKARIEIVPLIDVVFFLLATFVLFTMSMDKIRALDVEFPVPGEERKEALTLHIQVSETGAYYWKLGADSPAELITAAEIRPRLAQYRSSVALPRVFVRADNRAKLSSAVFMLDEVRLAGIKQVSVETVTSRTGQ